MNPTSSTTRRPVEVVIKIDRASFRCLYFRLIDGRPDWTEHRWEAMEFRSESEACKIAAAHHAHAVPVAAPPEDAVPKNFPHYRLPYKDPED